MNTIVALLFAGVVATVSSSAIRSTESGWGSNPPPSANINLEVDAALATAGEGTADAHQEVVEHVVGDSNVPAQLLSENGILASVSAGGDIIQVVQADTNNNSGSTANLVDAQQTSVAADILNASLVGATLAEVSNSAGTDTTNSNGLIAAAANSLNNISTRKN